MEESKRGRTHSTVGRTGSQVARNLRRFRTFRGITTEALAEQVANRGVPIQASAITKIEKEQRRVSVDELMALAVALNVTPNSLLLPTDVDRDQPVEITGLRESERIAAGYAWHWATGLGLLDEDAGPHPSVLPWWLHDQFNAEHLTSIMERLTPGAGARVTPDLLRATREGDPQAPEEDGK